MRRVGCAAIVGAAGCGAARAAGAATDNPPTIKDLESQQAEVSTAPPQGVDTTKTMDSYRRFLDLNAGDTGLRAEALRRLGDLNLESSESERIERELVTNEGLRATEAIHLYSALLKAYPKYGRNDAVLYQLARAYELNAEPDKAKAALDLLVTNYPGSHYLDEAQFRRGELLFADKSYRAAQVAYEAVVKIGPASPFYDQSLYKEGWSLFKQGENESSLDAFARVLDSILVSKHDPAELVALDALSRANRELVEDTFRVMSITFSYLEGPKSIDEFLRQGKPRPYAHLLYARLGDLYLEKERYTDAADADRAFVSRDRDSEAAPQLQMQAIAAYAKGGFAQLVLQGKQEFVEDYGFGTPFWQKRTPQSEPVVVRELKTNLTDLAQYYHAQAQRTQNSGDYREAVKWYRSFIASFPDDPDTPGMNFLLADTLFESKQYLEAGREYEHTAYGYGAHEKAGAAGYAAIVAYGKHEESLSGAAKAEMHARGVDSSLKFAQVFPQNPEAAQVLTHAAADLYAVKDYARAVAAAQTVLARTPPPDPAQQRIAWTVIANSEFEQGEFAQAEAGYKSALGVMQPNDPEHPAIVERLAAAIYQQGEQKNIAGDSAGAIDDFLRVSKEAPTSAVRGNGDFDAGALLITAKQWDRAIVVLEDFRRSFPDSPLLPDVTRKLAVAYSESNHPGPAAQEFAQIAQAPNETPEVQREATLRAADLYERAGDAAKSRAMWESFVRRFPQPLDPAMDARDKLRAIAQQAGDSAGRTHWLREIIAADRAAGAARTDRSRALAAKATLTLAEPAREEFVRIELVVPLKKSLAEKRRAMETALKDYAAAADYQVADVTTAATFESAELYRQLGKDLMSSERPKNLSKEELEQYDVLLEEQAFPFEEKAIKLHEVNTARAREGTYDEWVQKSYAALAQLNPGRYGKVEIDMQQDLQGSRLTDAEAALKAALERNPTSATAGNGLGIVERKLGKFAEAEAAYQRTIVAEPDYAPAYLNLGVLYDLYLAEPRKALEQYEHYMQLAGENGQVTSWVVELRKRVGAAAPAAKKETS